MSVPGAMALAGASVWGPALFWALAPAWPRAAPAGLAGVAVGAVARVAATRWGLQPSDTPPAPVRARRH